MTRPNSKFQTPNSFALDELQRWFQSAVTHPGELTQIAPDLNSVVTDSVQQSAEARLAIYARSYWARLLECLRDEYPAVRAAVGDDAFAQLAVGYLQEHPPTSYTLAQLGNRFANYLGVHGPRDDFAQALVDLASLERAVNEVFDEPGGETLGFLTPADLAAVPAEHRSELRLVPLPTYRLLSFDYDVNEWFTRLRGTTGGVRLPAQRTTHLALSRREFVVRRHPLSEVQAELLTALAGGKTLGEAIAITAERHPAALAELGSSLQSWFAEWSAAGFFQRTV